MSINVQDMIRHMGEVTKAHLLPSVQFELLRNYSTAVDLAMPMLVMMHGDRSSD